MKSVKKLRKVWAIVAVLFVVASCETVQAQEKQKADSVKSKVQPELFGRDTVQVDSALSRRWASAKVYRDKQGNMIFGIKVLVDQAYDPLGRILSFEDGSPYAGKGAVVFSGVTPEELEYLLAEFELFRAKKKVKQ